MRFEPTIPVLERAKTIHAEPPLPYSETRKLETFTMSMEVIHAMSYDKNLELCDVAEPASTESIETLGTGIEFLVL
jgi:hypothetical protein